MAPNNDEHDYYVIPVKQEQKSGMDVADVPEAMSDITGDDGLIHVELERDVIIERLARDLYKEPTAGIREYVNNEARQCRDAIKMGHEASIHVTVDGLTRTITIEGRGSMGMSMKTFRDVYTVLGRSGNMDGNESGQFGVGRASYLCLSDIVIFETFSRETDEKFGFVGKGGKVYEPIPQYAVSIKEYGSKAVVTVRKGVNIGSLVSYTRKVSRFLDVPVYLEVTSPVERSNDYRDDNVDIGVSQIGPIDKQGYLGDDYARQSWLTLENDDYKLEGYVQDEAYSQHMTTLLLGIPVESFGINALMNGSYILNIKDERKYQPTASRDSMSRDAQEKLTEMINQDMHEYLERLEINRLSDYAESKDAVLIKKARRYDSIVSADVLEFSKLLGMRFVASTDAHRPDQSGRKHVNDMSHVLESHTNVIFSRTRKSAVINALLDEEPNAVVLTPHGKWSHEIEEAFASLRKFGASELKEYMEAKKIKVVTEKSTGLKVYCADSDPVTVDFADIDNETIRIPRDIRMQEFMASIYGKPVGRANFIKDSRRLDDTPAKTLAAVCKKARRAKYETSEGIMTGAQIIKKYSSGFAVLKKADLDEPDVATYERCKRAFYGIKLIVTEKQMAFGNTVTPTIGLVLANVVSNPEPGRRGFFTIGEYNEQSILDEHILETLGIEFKGKWRDHPKTAKQYLAPINNATVRELYARFFNWSDSWDYSESYGSVKTDLKTNNVSSVFAAVDKWAAGKGKFEVCAGLLGMGWSHTYDDDHKRGYSALNDSVPLWIKRLAWECIARPGSREPTTATCEKRLQKVMDAMFSAGKIPSRADVKIDSQEKGQSAVTITTDAKPITLDDESPIIHVIWAAMNFGSTMPCYNKMEFTQDQKLKISVAKKSREW